SLDADTLAAAVAELPNVELTPQALVVQALVDTGLTSSLSEARRAIAQGGVYLNNVKVDDDAATLEGAALAGGRAVLRRGKKTLAGVVLGRGGPWRSGATRPRFGLDLAPCPKPRNVFLVRPKGKSEAAGGSQPQAPPPQAENQTPI